MVYNSWPSAPEIFNASLYPPAPPNNIPSYGPKEWLNKTEVDDLFGFGEKYNRRHPVFPKLPLPYNTILNTTSWFGDSIYLLGTSATSEYMLCSLRAAQHPNCSTTYQASLRGGSLRSYCDDRSHNADGKKLKPYSDSFPDAPVGWVERDWMNIASEWATALALNAGITDGAASNARLLTHLIPTTPALDPSLPSIAEALAVLAGCTLLISNQDAPFIHHCTIPLSLPVFRNFMFLISAFLMEVFLTKHRELLYHRTDPSPTAIPGFQCHPPYPRLRLWRYTAMAELILPSSFTRLHHERLLSCLLFHPRWTGDRFHRASESVRTLHQFTSERALGWELRRRTRRRPVQRKLVY